MPCPTVTAYIVLLSSAVHFQLCLGASQPTCVLSGLVLLDPILSGFVKPFPFLSGGWQRHGCKE